MKQHCPTLKYVAGSRSTCVTLGRIEFIFKRARAHFPSILNHAIMLFSWSGFGGSCHKDPCSATPMLQTLIMWSERLVWNIICDQVWNKLCIVASKLLITYCPDGLTLPFYKKTMLRFGLFQAKAFSVEMRSFPPFLLHYPLLTIAPVSPAHSISTAYVTLTCAFFLRQPSQESYFHLPAYPWPH